MKKFLTVATIVAASAVAGSAHAAQFVYQGGLLKQGMGFSTQTWNLQECLYKMGVNGATLSNGQKNVDGKFGRLTHEAVRKFQIQKGLTMIDGIVGPETGPKYTEACAAFYTNDSNTSDVVEKETEGDIESIEIKKGDDSKLLSDEKGQEFFEIEVEVAEDGSDVSIERMDLTFAVEGLTTKNYKLINKVDVEGFASKKTDDKDDWRGDDKQVVRIEGKKVAKAGEKTTFVVAIDTDEVENDEEAKITFSKVEILAFDGKGLEKGLNVDSEGSKDVSFSADSAFSFKSFEASDDMEEDMTVDISSETDKTELAIYEVEVEEEVKSAMFDMMKVTIENATEDNIAAVYAKVDNKKFEGELEGGVYEFDLDEMKFDAEDTFDVEIMADLAEDESEDDAFATTEFKVTNITFTEGEEVDGDDIDDISNDVDDATVVTTSLGDVTYEVSDLDTFVAAENATAADNVVKFDLKVSNDSGSELTIADVDAFEFDFEGIVAGDVTVTLDGETAAISNVVIADEESEEFEVTVTYSATSKHDVEVELKKVNDISVIEA